MDSKRITRSSTQRRTLLGHPITSMNESSIDDSLTAATPSLTTDSNPKTPTGTNVSTPGRDSIRTRSQNRLTSISHSTGKDIEPLTSSIDSPLTLTRKRLLSSSELSPSANNLPTELEDSNSNSSFTNQSSSTTSKKCKTKIPTTLTLALATQTPKSDSTLTEEILKCPLYILCESRGNISGNATTEPNHVIADSCPYYYGMSREECETRRHSMDNRRRSTSRQAAHEKIAQSTIDQIASFNAKLQNANSSDENEKETPGMPLSIFGGSIRQIYGSRQLLKQVPQVDDLECSSLDLEMFRDAVMQSAASNNGGSEDLSRYLTMRDKKFIIFGECEIETWYKSPYPDEYWNLNRIYICKFCLKYMKSGEVLVRHAQKCLWKHPPGKEIYRKDALSFFEVDGKSNKIYCQNLCLLAKLFLDHKTLYYDVEPFLFYVLTEYCSKTGAFNMIGYFSKEKQSVMNFNLSCILTLPQFMNKGYGKLLIDFSYLLSRVEEKIGSPERPLSDLGLVSYRSYWKCRLLTYLHAFANLDEISVKEISADTGIHPNDIVSTLQYIGLIKYWKGKHVILKDQELINKYILKSRNALKIDESCLRWTPYVESKIDAAPVTVSSAANILTNAKNHKSNKPINGVLLNLSYNN